MRKQLLWLSMLFMSASAGAQTNALPKLKLEEFSNGYDQPVGIENAGDSRLFIVERTGKIWICNANGVKSNQPFLNLTSKVKTTGGEQGLLGLAFDPNYSINGFFYVSYTTSTDAVRLSRFKVNTNNPNLASSSSEAIFLTQAHPFMNHNAGQLKFGPDNYLYMTIGDGGSAADPFNNAQNPNTFLGKLLRIDVSHGSNGKLYSIPPTNPFVSTAGYKKEIWATGLRNPWRFSFDMLNGDLWIPDVGQNDWEEINYQAASSNGGENYGWSCWEGAHFFKNNCNPNGTPPTFPISEYQHKNVAQCSGTVIGGFVYRGINFPRLYGKYIYADFCSGEFRVVYKDHDVWVNRFVKTLNPFSYSTFGEDASGELYIADLGNGEILHLVDSPFVTASRPQERSFMEIQQGENVSLFPNPNNGEFKVQVTSEKTQDYTVKVVNASGQEVFAEKRSAAEGMNEWMFSSEKFTKGFYILYMMNSDAVISRKFSVE